MRQLHEVETAHAMPPPAPPVYFRSRKEAAAVLQHVKSAVFWSGIARQISALLPRYAG